jgi:hemolysin activation/secretion protein
LICAPACVEHFDTTEKPGRFFMTTSRRLRCSFAAIFLTATLASAAEESGARVGTVIVRVDPIFEASDTGIARPLFRLADRLHVDTREETLRAHLLFESGDPFSQRVLDETARNLRELRYIREPVVRPIAFHDGVVDVEVRVQDVWTTNPGASFGRAGGENSSGFEFEELNLLGFGKQVSLGLKSNADRTSYTGKWHDPSVLGSRWTDTLAITRSNDGQGYELGLERPFFSLDSRWSAGVTAVHDSAIDRVYALGNRVAEYARESDDFDAHVGWSAGLHDGVARRWIAGVRRERVAFAASPALRARDLTYPYLRFESLQDDFETARNRDQIARTEDLYFGRRYAVELGWATPALGSDRSAAVLRALASRGFRLAGERSLFASGEVSGRMEGGSLTDALLSTGVRYYRPTSSRSTFFASINGSFGSRLDADHELSLDGELDLRGYPLRYQSGSSRVLLSLEERLFTDWSLWHLAQIGGAVFFDAGRTWGPSLGGGESLGVLTDVGFGLRLGNSRSALANVLHLDVAFPLDGDPSIRSVQFLVQTKRSF